MGLEAFVSGADGGAEGVGEGLGEALDVGVVFGFDHDASEGFGAGVAEDDAAVFAEGRLSFGEGARDFGKRFERRLGFHFYIDDRLRIVLEAFDERFDFAVHGDERGDFDGGEQAVTGGAVIEKDNVARLFAAKDVAAAEHFFQDVAIADGGAREGDIFAREDTFEAEIRHGSSDDAIAGELADGLQVAGRGEKNAIAVDDLAGFADEESAVGVAVESDTELGFFGDNAFLQSLQIQGTTVGVDIAAVGLDAHGDHIGTEAAEECRAEFVGGAIGAIENDTKTSQFSGGKGAAPQKGEVFGVERFVGNEGGAI